MSTPCPKCGASHCRCWAPASGSFAQSHAAPVAVREEGAPFPDIVSARHGRGK